MLYPLPVNDTLLTPEPTIRPELRVRVPARFTVPVALCRFRVEAVRVVPALAVRSVAPFNKITPVPTLMADEMVIAPEPPLVRVKLPFPLLMLSVLLMLIVEVARLLLSLLLDVPACKTTLRILVPPVVLMLVPLGRTISPFAVRVSVAVPATVFEIAAPAPIVMVPFCVVPAGRPVRIMTFALLFKAALICPSEIVAESAVGVKFPPVFG